MASHKTFITSPLPLFAYSRIIFSSGLEYLRFFFRKSIPKSGKGFTLIEILVVIGLIAILSGLGMVMSMQAFKISIFHNDRDLLVGALRKARSQSVNNMCFGTSGVCSDGRPHGVHIAAGNYTVFQGSCFDAPCVRDPNDVAVDEVTVGKPGVTITTTLVGPVEIVFNRLSGTAVTPGSVTLTDDNGETSVVTVNAEGRIIWTN